MLLAQRLNTGVIIIVGLGNPGRRYTGTRHNIGFDIIDALAKKHKIKVKSLRHKSLVGKGIICGHPVYLLKPLTYMNLSGEAVHRIVKHCRENEKERLIVVADDINLEPGRIRIRAKGSDGGHKGLKSIIAQLGHQTFIRMRIGVGSAPPGEDVVGHVLGGFTGADGKTMRECIERAVSAVECIIAEGVDSAMNKYN